MAHFCVRVTLMTRRGLCFTSDDNPTRDVCKWEIQFGTPHIPANGHVNEKEGLSFADVKSCLLLSRSSFYSVVMLRGRKIYGSGTKPWPPDNMRGLHRLGVVSLFLSVHFLLLLLMKPFCTTLVVCFFNYSDCPSVS